MLVESVTNLSIHKFLAGHLGGMQQLGSQIEHNNIDLLIFFVIRSHRVHMSRMSMTL